MPSSERLKADLWLNVGSDAVACVSHCERKTHTLVCLCCMPIDINQKLTITFPVFTSGGSQWAVAAS